MIVNKQKKVRLAARPLQEFLRRAQRELKIPNSEITIAFVSDAEIARWNEAYRKKKGPTDVLSFPATAGARKNVVAKANGAKKAEILGGIAFAPETAKRREILGDMAIAPEILGDIAIAPETARRYAKKNGRSLAAEIRVLMLHGVLHLMGYDHESDQGQMNRIEQRLRRRLGIA